METRTSTPPASSMPRVEGLECTCDSSGSVPQQDNDAEWFFIGSDSPREGEDCEHLQEQIESLRLEAERAAVAHAAVMASKLSLSAQVETLRSESEATRATLEATAKELASRKEEVREMQAQELVDSSHTHSLRLREELQAEKKETSKLREVIKFHMASAAGARLDSERLGAQEAQMSKQLREEASAAAVAASIIEAMGDDAEVLRKKLVAATQECDTLRMKMDARRSGEVHAVNSSDSAGLHETQLAALNGLWVAEPSGEVHYINGSSGCVSRVSGQWAHVVVYGDGLALLPENGAACQGELVYSKRGSVLLWPQHGAWVQLTLAAVWNAWDAASRQLHCPAGHRLEWTRSTNADGESLPRRLGSCRGAVPWRGKKAAAKLTARGEESPTVCSACRFPAFEDDMGTAALWQCKRCRYNVCISCAASSGASSPPAAVNVVPTEVQRRSILCDGCLTTCFSGTVVVGSRIASDDQRHACLRCFSQFVTHD